MLICPKGASQPHTAASHAWGYVHVFLLRQAHTWWMRFTVSVPPQPGSQSLPSTHPQACSEACVHSCLGLLRAHTLCACSYMDYLLEALKRRELFSWLHLAPLTFWHALLLRDRFNFLGLVAPVPDALKQQLSQQPGTLTQVLGESTHHLVKCFKRDRELTPGSLETRQLRPEPCSETGSAGFTGPHAGGC